MGVRVILHLAATFNQNWVQTNNEMQLNLLNYPRTLFGSKQLMNLHFRYLVERMKTYDVSSWQQQFQYVTWFSGNCESMHMIKGTERVAQSTVDVIKPAAISPPNSHLRTIAIGIKIAIATLERP
jgi:hypothetical protein